MLSPMSMGRTKRGTGKAAGLGRRGIAQLARLKKALDAGDQTAAITETRGIIQGCADDGDSAWMRFVSRLGVVLMEEVARDDGLKEARMVEALVITAGLHAGMTLDAGFARAIFNQCIAEGKTSSVSEETLNKEKQTN